MLTLKNNYDFTRIFRKGKKAATPCLSIYWLVKKSKYPFRFGVAVTRLKYGAVQRNRLKRLLRENIRHSVLPELKGVDCIVIAKGPIEKINYQRVNKDLTFLINQRVIPSLDKEHCPFLLQQSEKKSVGKLIYEENLD